MNKKTKLILIIPISLAVIIIIAIIAYNNFSQQEPKITPTPDQQEQEISNFDQCAAAGNPVMESFPRQCQANGKTFIEEIGNEQEKKDLIRIDNPRPNQTITSPTVISGQARGTWFFEASFPILIMDSQGNDLGFVLANAKGEWMTENFVDFEAELKFDQPQSNSGLLILKKDNPSGLPENDDQLVVPVNFDPNAQKKTEPQQDNKISRLNEFENALNNNNTEEMKKYMSDPFDLIHEATECCGCIYQKDGLTELPYVKDDSKFNFNQNSNIINKIKNKYYSFKDDIIGIDQYNTVVSYHLNEDNKVDQLYFSVSTDILYLDDPEVFEFIPPNNCESGIMWDPNWSKTSN